MGLQCHLNSGQSPPCSLAGVLAFFNAKDPAQKRRQPFPAPVQGLWTEEGARPGRWSGLGRGALGLGPNPGPHPPPSHLGDQERFPSLPGLLFLWKLRGSNQLPRQFVFLPQIPRNAIEMKGCPWTK